MPAELSSRVVTLPNALSGLRLLGVPVFLWLVLGPEADGWAVALLMVSGVTDYLDGRIARAWNQFTRLGQLLDPLADRLYILATIGALTIRGVLPLAFAVALLARDALLAALLPVLRRHGYGPLPVHYLGKAATFNLLSALPLVLLGDGSGTAGDIVQPIGWAFAVWGLGLYWYSAVLYVVHFRQLITRPRAGP